MTTVDLSIVIVEYRCIELVESCLRSLAEHLEKLEWECLIVSNSEYGDADAELMCERLGRAHVTINDRNRGYAGGVNRALSQCSAPFIFVLNPDCLLADNQVDSLIKCLEENPDIGAVGPKVVDTKGVVQPSCRRFPRPWTFLLVRSILSRLPLASAERRRYMMEDFSHNSVRDVDWLSGGAVMVRRKAVDEVGPMDERFFLYMEDVDWSRRFWQSGYRVVYCPTCVVIHAGQHASLNPGLKMLASRHTRLHLMSMLKYFAKYRFRSMPEHRCCNLTFPPSSSP